MLRKGELDEAFKGRKQGWWRRERDREECERPDGANQHDPLESLVIDGLNGGVDGQADLKVVGNFEGRGGEGKGGGELRVRRDLHGERKTEMTRGRYRKEQRRLQS